MPARGRDDERHRGDAAGPPSARSRHELSDDLRRELADARVRLQEAALRAEAHRLLGDDDAAARAMAEQRDVLDEVEGRLGRAVSVALVQRDAEEVLADASVDHGAHAPVDDAGRGGRQARRPVLSGIASVVALLVAVSIGFVGLQGQSGPLDALGAGSTASPDGVAQPSAALPSQEPARSEDGTGRASRGTATPSAGPGTSSDGTSDEPRAGGPGGDVGTFTPLLQGDLGVLVPDLDEVIRRLVGDDLPVDAPPLEDDAAPVPSPTTGPAPGDGAGGAPQPLDPATDEADPADDPAVPSADTPGSDVPDTADTPETEAVEEPGPEVSEDPEVDGFVPDSGAQ